MTTEITTDVQQEQTAIAKVTEAGFHDADGFQLIQRIATMFSKSTIIPKEYQSNLSNCVIAVDIATRMRKSPLLVMQHLNIIHGRPSWSAVFLLSTINTCGKFTPLRYEFVGTPGKDDYGCIAWAVEHNTGEVLKGTKVDIAMAKAEGWYNKTGSKWQTMPEQMLRYRSAAFFVRAYAPELSLGFQTTDEVEDIIDGEVVKPQGRLVAKEVAE